MIGPSKILTVSYGTFSCTLEGFDDPFNTMRAIAEYFRDLAAEDRYFGAEPPTPDAAMLHKIAEREVQRRVEAKIQDNGVILRTGDAMDAPRFAPATAPQPAVLMPAADALSAPMPDGVAAKLLRIRAAVANAESHEPRAEAAPLPLVPAPNVFAPTQPVLAEYSEDEHAEDLAVPSDLTATFAPEAFHTDLDDGDAPIEPAVGPSAIGDDIASFDAGPVETALDVTEDDSSAAAEMAVVDTIDDDDFAEANDIAEAGDFAAPGQVPEDAQIDAMADAEIALSAEADDSLLASLNLRDAAPAIVDEADIGAADIDADEDALEAHGDFEVVNGDTGADDAASPDVDDRPAAVVTRAEMVYDLKADHFDEDDDLAQHIEADIHPDAEFDDEIAEAAVEVAEIDPVLEEIDRAYDPETPVASGPSEKALRARARVIKVRREDAAPEPDASADEAATQVAAMLAADADADADLRRELQALRQMEPATGVEHSDAGDDTAAPEDDARQRLDDAGEAAVSRLIEQTNEAMAVPENRRRLSAIAHLKAAVAATVAERFSRGGNLPKEAETKRLDPYREDLARVVRPQSPNDAEDTPAPQRPAPLVLVSAQRIDRPRTATPGETPTQLTAVPNSPVRPRRVTSAALAVEGPPEVEEGDDEIDTASLFTDVRGFAEFSERLGANSLAEILEAAAAYSVCIEGRPYFSRPQLMSQIGALSADSEYTREDGLRTFGALLREGRIQKIKRGQFVLAESSRYLAEARNLAG